MLLHDRSADSQTEPGSALLPGVGGFNLLEAVEDRVQLLKRNAAALVGDAQLHGVGIRLQPQCNGALGGRKLDRIGEQIGDDLQDPVGIAVEEDALGSHTQAELQMDARGVCHRLHRLDRLLRQVAQGAASNVKGSSAGLHPLQIQNVINKTDEPVSIGQRNAQKILRLGIDCSHEPRRKQP